MQMGKSGWPTEWSDLAAAVADADGASGVASAFNNAVMNRAKVRCGDAKMNDVLRGAVAQLGERIVRNDEAAGSIPASSTIFSIACGTCPTSQGSFVSLFVS